MSDASRQLAGILFVLVPTVELGGWSLLRMGALSLAASAVTLGLSLL